MQSAVPEDIKNSILKAFSSHCRFICVFGSILEPRFGPESDIDIAVYPKAKLDQNFMSKLSSLLIDEIGRDVDCIDLSSADPIITMQVLRNGKLIYFDEIDFFHQFKAHKISEYIDFKRSREIVEKNLVSHRIIGGQHEES